jgi:hypothetical protein
MKIKTLLNFLAAACLAAALVPALYADDVIGHFNVMVNGHGSIVCQDLPVRQVKIKILGGPLHVTKFVVHFADKKLAAVTRTTADRSTGEWISEAATWPAPLARKVASVEYWYTGFPGTFNTRMEILGTR